MLTVARRALPSGAVEVTGRVVTSFGLSVTQLGRRVTLQRDQIAVGCKGVPVWPGGAAVLIRASHAAAPARGR
jgi:hypothetical protein